MSSKATFLGPDCKQISYPPNTFRVAPSSLFQEQKCVNGFLQSMPRSTSVVCQPQPFMPVEHHQHLVHQGHLGPFPRGHFQQVPHGNFVSAPLSLQRPSGISTGYASQLAGPPFGYTPPHGALPAPVTSSSRNPLVPVVNQGHYNLHRSLPCQSAPGPMYPSQRPLEFHPVPQATIGPVTGCSSVNPCGRCRNRAQNFPGQAFDSSKRELLSSKGIQMGSDLQGAERTLSACALVDRAPDGYQLIQQPFHHTRTPGPMYPSQSPLEFHPVPQSTIGPVAGCSSSNPCGCCRNSAQNFPGQAFDSSKRELLSSKGIQLGSDLQGAERTLSASALVDRAPDGYQLIQQPFHHTQFNKRSRPISLGLDSAPELGRPKLVRQTLVTHKPTVAHGVEYQFGKLIANESRSPSPRAPVKPVRTFQHAKRHRRDAVAPLDRVSQADQIIRSRRAGVHARNASYQNTFSPMPENVSRPGSCGQGEGGAGSPQDKNAHKLGRIRSIERALKAVETVSVYLSKEAREVSVQADNIENHALGPPCHSNSASRRAVGDPQEFLVLGEIGGRLRRRLEAERR